MLSINFGYFCGEKILKKKGSYDIITSDKKAIFIYVIFIYVSIYKK